MGVEYAIVEKKPLKKQGIYPIEGIVAILIVVGYATAVDTQE